MRNSLKANYIHQNPVEKGLVVLPEDYIYGGAKDYAVEARLLNLIEVGHGLQISANLGK